MFVTKKKYAAVTTEMGRQIVARDDTLMIREATIGRLQRENATLLSEVSELRAADERRKAQARSNLKQNRQARAKQQAGEVVA